MKRKTLWRAALWLAVAGFSPSALCGGGFEKSYSFDLVDWDKETVHLMEPDGSVPFKLFSPRAKDEKAMDKLYRDQILPVLQRERAELHGVLKGIDDRLGGGQLDDEAVASLANEAHDAYHASVDRILQFVTKWNQSNENPYHRSKAVAVSNFFAPQPPWYNPPYQKTWSSSSSRSSTQTVATPTGGVTRTTTTTSGASVSVGVNPVGAIMGLSGLFGKKRKAPPEPPYLADVRKVVDAANAMGDTDERDNKNCRNLLAELKRYEGADAGGREKSRKRLLPLLDSASRLNGALRRQAAALPALVDKSLNRGAGDDPQIAGLLLSLPPLSASLESACGGVEAGIGAVRQALSGQSDLTHPVEAFAKALTERERLAGDLQDKGYQVSRGVDY